MATYAEMIERALPEAAPQLQWLVGEIGTGLAGIAPGVEVTHGDFHEGQLFVSGGLITGVLDIDTVGPGRRADDLACLVAHLSTVQRMSTVQAARVSQLVRTWMPVFDARVDPVELRLRAAGVVVSNHGGRQLDTVLSGADALAPIAEAVAGRIDVLVDGGIRRGTDVVKALALGARAVLIGRPVTWGLAVGGAAGAQHVLETLLGEFVNALALVGCPRAADLNASFVAAAPWAGPA